MVWFTLALFAISFIATALLAPKPEIENARPESLDPDNFPKATEEDPVPLLLGCAYIKGPNTLWYGNFQTIPITERVKTGLFSKETVTTGHNYYLSIDLGLCLGPNAQIKQIWIDDVPVNAGITTDNEGLETFYDAQPTSLRVYDGSSELTGQAVGTPLFFPQYGPGFHTEFFDLETDFGLDTEVIDQEGAKVTVSYQVKHTRITVPTSGTANLVLSFYDEFNQVVTSPDGLGNQSLDVSVSSVPSTDPPESGWFTLEIPLLTIPSTARELRVGSNWNPFIIIGTGTGVRETKIIVNGAGILVSEQSFDILEPDLFGGEGQGGGHVGNVDYYPGSFTQLPSAHVEATVGSGLVPGYRGVAHMVWKNHYIGETPALRKTKFLMSRYTNDLVNGFGGRLGAGGDDIDLAEALYSIIIDDWHGLSVSELALDKTSFQTASTTLIAEGNGGSVVITSPQNGKKVITEILRQIDGILYVDQSTGLVVLDLIRDDYDAGTLTIYDEDDIIKINSFKKTAWADVKSEVRVTYPSRDKEDSNLVAIAQNMATANMLGQSTVSNVSFPFCYSKPLANQLAHRELSVASTPLFTMQIEFNRNAYNLKPGGVVKISWPEYSLSEIIMRVQKIDGGMLMDGRIVVDLIQDIFAVADVVMADTEDTSWVDDRPEPEEILNQFVVEMPHFYSSNLQFPVPDGFGNIIPFAERPKLASTNFSLNAGVATDELVYKERSDRIYPLTGLFNADYVRYAGFDTGLDATGFTIKTVVGGGDVSQGVPQPATTAEIQSGSNGLIYANGEWMAYEGVTDNMDGTYTLTNVYRALLGTHPVEHLTDSRIWFLSSDLLGTGALGGELLEDGTVYWKMLDQVGPRKRSVLEETESSQVLQDLADRPLRPRDLNVEGSRASIPFDFGSDPTVDLTWVNSSRDATTVTFEDDATQTPDQTEVYDLEVWIDGVEAVGLADTNITSPYALDVTGEEGSELEIRLYSRRTVGDLKSSAYYAVFPGSLDSLELLSGDMQDTSADTILLSGDMSDGPNDAIKLSGDEA